MKYLIILALLLNSCAEAVIGAGAATGIALAQERTVGNAIDDATIWTKIKGKFMQVDINNLFTKIEVKVNEGKVLLTGSVADPETRIEAVKIAWSQNGVKEVINEIMIDNPSSDKAKLQEYARDSWITAQIKGKLLLHKNIRSINYTLDTVGGVVYLMGVAQNQEELDLVTRIAGQVKYVQKVISFVRLKD